VRSALTKIIPAAVAYIVIDIYCKRRCTHRCCGEYKNDYSLICYDVVTSVGGVLEIMWFFYIYDDGVIAVLIVLVHNVAGHAKVKTTTIGPNSAVEETDTYIYIIVCNNTSI
jgi:hypothetical protein